MAARHHYARLILLAAPMLWAAPGPTPMSLAEAAVRRPVDALPVHLGQSIEVTGTVSAKAVRVREYSHLAFQDETEHGLTLESIDHSLDQWQPGDRLKITGTIGHRAGLPVLQPESTLRISSAPPPPPKQLKIADVNSYRWLGILVGIEAEVLSPGENAGGEVLALGGGRGGTIRVFLPREQNQRDANFGSLHSGDRVRVVGLSSQYCPVPPHDHSFQIIIGDAGAVTLIERSWIIPPDWVLVTLLGTLLAFTVWWHRERVSARQRKGMRGLMTLAEDVVAATTPTEIARSVNTLLPPALGASDSALYLHNRTTQTLDPVLPEGARGLQPIGIHTEIGGLASAVALAFRNRAMLLVPDTRSSPLFRKDEPELPSAAAFVPMLTHQEAFGVLMMSFSQHRELGKDEQAAVQHVANQIATSLKLQEQKVMREQLLRSEKMAATGQLISSIAAELRVPLEAIKMLADDLVSRAAPAYPDPELRGVALEAEKAAGILSRLVSFSRVEPTQSEPVDVSTILRAAIDLRQREWMIKGIATTIDVGDDEPLTVMGAQNHLEQVVLNLLMQAESAVEGRPEKKLRITAHKNGDEVVAQIEYSDGGDSSAREAVAGEESRATGALGLEVCQAILQTLGGEVKITPAGPITSQFEIRLPAYESEEKAARRRDRASHPVRLLTILVVEPELAVQRRLMTMLSQRGHRSIPVATAEDGLDVSHRIHFDAVFCAVRLPHLNWVEFQQRVRRNIPIFVLMSEGADAGLSRSLKTGEGFMVGRALEEDELERVLVSIESRQEASSRR